MPSSQAETESSSSAAFAQAAQDDAELRNGTPSDENPQAMSFFGRLLVFLIFPFLTAIGGLYLGYIRKLRDADYQMDFDKDFIFPFLCALSISVVVAIQTRGFSSGSKPPPFVKWPKARRKKKILHRRVVVDDDDADAVPDADKKND